MRPIAGLKKLSVAPNHVDNMITGTAILIPLNEAAWKAGSVMDMAGVIAEGLSSEFGYDVHPSLNLSIYSWKDTKEAFGELQREVQFGFHADQKPVLNPIELRKKAEQQAIAYRRAKKNEELRGATKNIEAFTKAMNEFGDGLTAPAPKIGTNVKLERKSWRERHERFDISKEALEQLIKNGYDIEKPISQKEADWILDHLPREDQKRKKAMSHVADAVPYVRQQDNCTEAMYDKALKSVVETSIQDAMNGLEISNETAVKELKKLRLDRNDPGKSMSGKEERPDRPRKKSKLRFFTKPLFWLISAIIGGIVHGVVMYWFLGV